MLRLCKRCFKIFKNKTKFGRICEECQIKWWERKNYNPNPKAKINLQ